MVTVITRHFIAGLAMALAVVVQTGGLGGRQLEKYRGLGRFLDALAG